MEQWMRWGMAVLGMWLTTGSAADVAAVRDTLIYKDGDKVQGRLVEQTKEAWVFRSDRFGDLRVPLSEADVVRGGPVTAGIPGKTAGGASGKVAEAVKPRDVQGRMEDEDAEEERASVTLTKRVRNFFGPWRGRVSFATEVISDLAERHSSSYEVSMKRKWRVDEVQLNGRFDYNQTNSVATTDVLRLGAHWRHDFSKVLFAQYRPTFEWNRASRVRGVPNDYMLLQQEVGAGYQIVNRSGAKVRLGVSQNRFDTWNSAVAPLRSSRSVQSVFEEVEVMLPWRLSLSQRGVWYPVTDRADGWENRVDLSKKLTETLSVSARHEVRRDNPDGKAPDYTRLRFLLGVDF